MDGSLADLFLITLFRVLRTESCFRNKKIILSDKSQASVKISTCATGAQTSFFYLIGVSKKFLVSSVDEILANEPYELPDYSKNQNCEAII